MGWGVGMANVPKQGAWSWQFWGGWFVRGRPAWDVRARENDNNVQMGVEGRCSSAGSWILNVVQVMSARAWAKWEGFIPGAGVPKWNVDLWAKEDVLAPGHGSLTRSAGTQVGWGVLTRQGAVHRMSEPILSEEEICTGESTALPNITLHYTVAQTQYYSTVSLFNLACRIQL